MLENPYCINIFEVLTKLARKTKALLFTVDTTNRTTKYKSKKIN
jgi:hypothetical protein